MCTPTEKTRQRGQDPHSVLGVLGNRTRRGCCAERGIVRCGGPLASCVQTGSKTGCCRKQEAEHAHTHTCTHTHEPGTAGYGLMPSARRAGQLKATHSSAFSIEAMTWHGMANFELRKATHASCTLAAFYKQQSSVFCPLLCRRERGPVGQRQRTRVCTRVAGEVLCLCACLIGTSMRCLRCRGWWGVTASLCLVVASQAGTYSLTS